MVPLTGRSPSPSIELREDGQRQSSTDPTPDPEIANLKEKGKATSESPDDDDDEDARSLPSDPSSTSTSPTPAPSSDLSTGAWQAIYSPQHNAYYFYNASTGETTWINPLQPNSSHPADPASSESSSSVDPNRTDAEDSGGGVDPDPYDPNSLEARAIAAGIDPSLAYLDPSLLAGSSAIAPTGTFTAKFNARTGAFAAAHARAPSHLSEYERMKRMSEFYFDRDQEEKERGEKKRKRPTKKDLDRFKEQKKMKKIAKTAWLRT
ncbi:hypothetical protein BU15DRAFT_90985 [Melanogaster broomeanus]|nr:hypothetical protein BU15DRAFT_90985 [Melanogaster broomeanus]